MIDTTQILLYTVVSALTVLLIIIGIQVIFILQEVRKMFQKMNRMLEDATVLTGTISRSVGEFSGFASGLKSVLKIFSVFSKKEDEKNAAGK